jgi:hypothetical protein
MYELDVKRQLLIELRRGFRGLKSCLGGKKVDEAVYARSKKKPTQQPDAPSPAAAEEFLTFKTTAAIRVVEATLQARLSLDDALVDLDRLYKEIQPSVQTLFGRPEFGNRTADEQRACKDHWQEIRDALNLLCLVRDGSVQTGFIQIYFAAAGLQKSFKRVKLLFTNWSKHWGTCFHTDDLQQMMAAADEVCEPKGESKQSAKTGEGSGNPAGGSDQTDYTSGETEETSDHLHSIAKKIGKLALAAAKSCSSEDQDEKLKKVCAKLIAIHDRFDEIICLLDRLQCSPDMEPTFRELVQRRLDRAAFFLQYAFAGAETVSLACRDTTSLLIDAWKGLQSSITVLEREIAAYEKRQLCGSSGLCSGALAQLRLLIGRGLVQARSLNIGEISPAVRNGQYQLINEAQTLLLGFVEGGLRRRAVNGFWPYIANIRTALSRCNEEVEPECLVTKEDLVSILSFLKSACAGVASHPISPPSPSSATLAFCAGEPFGQSIGSATGLTENLNRFVELASALSILVPEPLKQGLTGLIVKSQSAQFRLANASAVGGVDYPKLIQFEEGRLKGCYYRLATVLGLAQRSDADRERIARLQAQHPLPFQHMKLQIGFDPATGQFSAGQKGGA